MWPGIVGKGAPGRRADHPARHAARADRQRRGRRPEVRRRRSLRRRPALRHRQRPRRRQADDRPHRQLRPRRSAPSSRRSGAAPAAARRWARRTSASSSSTQVRKACEIGRQMRELGIRPSGGIRIDSSTSVEAWDKDPKGNTKLHRRDLPRGRRHRRRPRRVPRRRGRDLLGRHAFLARRCATCSKRSTARAVVGYQADMAHSMLYTLGYNAEEDRILPDGLRLEGHRRPRRRLHARSPTRSAPGPSTSTSPRTTAPSSAPATTRRPAATARSTTRTAGSTSSSTPATGCATRTAT